MYIHLEMNKYELVMVKAEMYLQSQRVKEMKPKEIGYDVLQYGISKKDHILLAHVMALIL